MFSSAVLYRILPRRFKSFRQSFCKNWQGCREGVAVYCAATRLTVTAVQSDVVFCLCSSMSVCVRFSGCGCAVHTVLLSVLISQEYCGEGDINLDFATIRR